jgi:hypothetical protein
MLKILIYVVLLLDLFQDKGNVCLGLLNGTEIDHGSTTIDGGIHGFLLLFSSQ